MKNQVEERTAQKETGDQCHHYWIIEVANGPTSMGECKYCGERREFQNAFPTFNPLRKGRVTVNVPADDEEDEEEDLI
jgi:hypothetical protein